MKVYKLNLQSVGQFNGQFRTDLINFDYYPVRACAAGVKQSVGFHIYPFCPDCNR